MDTHQQSEDTNKENHTILVWLALAVVAAIMFLMWDSLQQKTSADRIRPITITIDYGMSQRMFSGTFESQVRVWDLLQQATAISNTELKARNNFIIEKIDGHENGDGGEWRYYVNGARELSPPFERMVSDGDAIEFRFEG